MSCSNCFNGCADIVSDQCVKYTGIDIPLLGIENGDSLSYVEQALIGFLSSALDGTGIIPTIAPEVICSLVQGHLPDCGNISIVDLITALIESACDLQTAVDAVEADIATLNADYDVDCLTGVVDSSDTHDVLQAVIDKLCTLDLSVTAIAADLAANYVAIADLDTLIAAYLASITTSTLMSNKMVPYVAMPYYGDLVGKFDAGGAGIVGSDWENVYLCNGQNGTPDLRGRTTVGRTDMPGGGAFDAAVDPAIAPNPTYADFLPQGATNITLGINDIPSHTHTPTITATTADHYHYEFTNAAIDSHTPVTATNYVRSSEGWGDEMSYSLVGLPSPSTPNVGRSSSAHLDIVVVSTIANAGGDGYHMNIQPVLPSYYIMYIPI